MYYCFSPRRGATIKCLAAGSTKFYYYAFSESIVASVAWQLEIAFPFVSRVVPAGKEPVIKVREKSRTRDFVALHAGVKVQRERELGGKPSYRYSRTR